MSRLLREKEPLLGAFPLPQVDLQARYEPLIAAHTPSGSGTDSEDEAAPALERRLAEADASSKRAARRQLQGLALYALSTLFGTAMSLMAKLAGRRGIGVFEVVLIRSLFLVAFTAPELLWRRFNPFGDKIRRWLYLLRGVLGFFSVSSLYLAVSLLPMGDAAVLSFLSPVFVAAVSPCVLQERPSMVLFLAIPFCMVGVVLVSKPSFIFGAGKAGAISALGVGVGIMQAVFNAAARMAVRALSIGSNEPMAAILFSMGLVNSICAAGTLTALRNFVLPSDSWTCLILLVNGISGYLYQVALTAGLQRADAAPAVAMSYLGVIWGILVDVAVFGTPPTLLSLAGAAVISASSFFVALGERRRQQRAKMLARFQASEERLLGPGSSSRGSVGGSMHGGGDLPPPLPPWLPVGVVAGAKTDKSAGGANGEALEIERPAVPPAAGVGMGGAVPGEEWEGIRIPTGREPLAEAKW